MDTNGFVFEPSCGRGTISILWGCLVTIVFVVWTVLHTDTTHPTMSKPAWAVFVFFVPEAMPAGAIEQLVRARQLQKRLRSIPGWEDWTLKRSFFIIKKGVTDHEGEVLSASGLVRLATEKKSGLHMSMLPSESQIDKRSKTSWFEKIVASGQAVWFVANIISRLAGGYQITPLEDMTVAYTCCGLISAIAWFRCPQGVEEAFEIDRARTIAAPCNDDTPEKDSDHVVRTTVYVILAVFTGIHLAAWNYPFPSAPEAWLWRAGSMATLMFGVVLLYFGDRRVGRSRHWSLAVVVPGYLMARLSLMVVASTAFRRMPASVFDTPDWLDYWGHIGK